MNKPVSYYISELLFLHDCVVLPEFGGFVGNNQSAKLNTITGELLPPSKQLLFNNVRKFYKKGSNTGLDFAYLLLSLVYCTRMPYFFQSTLINNNHHEINLILIEVEGLW